MVFKGKGPSKRGSLRPPIVEHAQLPPATAQRHTQPYNRATPDRLARAETLELAPYRVCARLLAPPN